MTLGLILAVEFLAHLIYLGNHCPIDLSDDEAHYWDWSRHLDLSYYSKGPLVAYIIRASCSILGETMIAVRLPAMILAIGTSILSYWLTRKLLNSDRLALGAVLLSRLVPLFVAGSLLMTIDPPLCFCWILATCLAALAIFDDKKWTWGACGAAVGIGFLAKYSMFLWPVSLALFLMIQAPLRKHLRSPWLWLGAVIAALCTGPVMVWNVRHHWVSLRHVAAQAGLGSRDSLVGLGSVAQFAAGQFLVIGPPLFILILCSAACALGIGMGKIRELREVQFLLWMGLPTLVFFTLVSFHSKVQANWPAPAYLTLVILTGWFLSTRLQSMALWKRWRALFYATVISGLAMTAILHFTQLLYPFLNMAIRSFPQVRFQPHQLDPAYKLRGWTELGSRISSELNGFSEGAFILSDHYQTTAEMAFYVAGRPKTYFAGSYFHDPAKRMRFSQYDLWPDRNLNSSELQGRNAIYLGDLNEDIQRAFIRVEKAPLLRVIRSGCEVRAFQYWRCFGFKKMQRPNEGAKY